MFDKDPIGAFEEVRKNLTLYIKTAFGTRYPEIESERETLLLTDRVLTRQPWIEPRAKFKPGKWLSELTPKELVGLDKATVEDFVSLAQCGLFGNYPLHAHQFRMLQTV